MIIYVEPNGQAHTIDQMHQSAIIINTVKDISKAFRSMAESVGVAMKEIAKTFKEAFLCVKEIVTELVDQVEKAGVKCRKTHYNQNAEWHLKNEYRNVMRITKNATWRPFKRFRRRH